MKQKGWVIIDSKINIIFIGWWLTKKDAIKEHCEALGRSWDFCRKQGHRAKKVEIIVTN